MASTEMINAQIDSMQTLEEAMPFLKALPINVIKIFLIKSAKYGFFDKVALHEIHHDQPKTKEQCTQTYDREFKEQQPENDDNDDDDKATDEPLIATADATSKRSNFGFKLNKSNKRLFDVIEHGVTLKGNFKRDYQYPSDHWQNNVKLHEFGTVMFGKFVTKPHRLCIHIKLIRNCINHSIAFGFIGMRCNQYVDSQANTGKHHSCMLYGDGRYYTSYEFGNEAYENNTILPPLVNYFKTGDIIVVELDMKSAMPVGKIYNIQHEEDESKQFVISLKTANNAIALCLNVTFKPCLTVIKQTFE